MRSIKTNNRKDKNVFVKNWNILFWTPPESWRSRFPVFCGSNGQFYYYTFKHRLTFLSRNAAPLVFAHITAYTHIVPTKTQSVSEIRHPMCRFIFPYCIIYSSWLLFYPSSGKKKKRSKHPAPGPAGDYGPESMNPDYSAHLGRNERARLGGPSSGAASVGPAAAPTSDPRFSDMAPK